MIVIKVNVKNMIWLCHKKFMKTLINSLIYLIVLSSFGDSVYSLSNYQIKKICQKDQRRSKCIKNLKFKKLKLLEGNRIEIPVIPFKNK